MTIASPPSLALSIRQLRVDYGNFTAVHDLNLDIGPGEIFGLVGPNGAGKTSTIRVLAGLLQPTYGEVSILGYDLFEKASSVHSHISYMPDLAPVIPDLRVWEFLDLYAQAFGLEGEERGKRVDEVLEKVQMSQHRKVMGKALSRGMTQRVVLAKSLLNRPKFLLLDEPASGMDPIARMGLRDILQELAAEGATVLISSHILSELSEMCTSVGIMHLGRLVKNGPINQVLDNLGASHAFIQIEVLENPASTLEFLKQQKQVSIKKQEEKLIHIEAPGDADAQAQLLKDMVKADLPIRGFTRKGSSIESILKDLMQDKGGQA